MAPTHPLHVNQCHSLGIVFAEEKVPALAVAVDQGEAGVVCHKIIQGRGNLRHFLPQIPGCRHQVGQLGQSLQQSGPCLTGGFDL